MRTMSSRERPALSHCRGSQKQVSVSTSSENKGYSRWTHHAAEDRVGLVKEDEGLVKLGDGTLIHDNDAVVEGDCCETAAR